MGIDVLGPLTVDGGSLSPKERAVLAALVLKYGQGATTDELADACWGERLPSTWRKQLQALIVGNRRILGADAIATIPSGYSLTVSPDTIDAARFERLVSRAAEHFANAEPDRGVDALENALRLWRGTAYPELSSWDAAVAESARLDDLRKAAEEDLLDGRLACGEHRSVVPDAELLVREESLRERRWAILATALYRAGRQADALAALREARRRLDEDLGIEPGRELEDLERGILQHDPSLDAPPPPDRTRSDCPYKGLACFEADDEELFFGRAAETSAALSRLDRTSFLAFSGASGSGKSSLVLAGVVPALRRAGRSVVVVTPVPPASTRLRDAVTRMPRAGTIVVDQFEEVFGADQHADTARECCALLADVVAAGGTVILTVRSDFLDDCAADPRLAPLLASDVQIVGPMSREALREAIVEPARVTGLRLENGLAELVMRDAAGEAGLLPLMSHALVETWLLRDGATLTIEAYEQAGGLGAALASTAERVYTSLDDEERAACRSLLLRLVVLGVEGSPVRRRAHLRPLREDPVRSGIIGRFVQARLLTASDDTVTLTHESLATAWPRLRAWLDEDAQNARVMEQVTAASEAWEADGEPAEDLYRGARLETALEWRASASPDLTGTEARFLDASAARDRAETDAAAARARRDARQNRTLRGLLTGAGALLVASVAATVFAIDSGTQATRQGASANVEALVGTSLALRASQRDVAALLAVEAHRRWPEDPRPLSALLGTFTAAPDYLGSAYPAGADRIAGALVPGTDSAVIMRDDGTAATYDIATAGLLSRLEVEPSPVAFGRRPIVAVSSDADTAVILRSIVAGEYTDFFGTDFSRTSELIAVDLPSGGAIADPLRLSIGGDSMSLTSDGTIAAIAAQDGRVRVVDVAAGQVVSTINPAEYSQNPPWTSTEVAFVADDLLAIGTSGGEIVLVDPESSAVLQRIPTPEDMAGTALLTTRTGMLVTSGSAGIAAVDLAVGAPAWEKQTGDGGCPWLVASADGSRLWCGTARGLIVERDLATGEAIADLVEPRVGDLFLSTDESELIAFSAGSAAISRWGTTGDGAVTHTIADGSRLFSGYGPADSRIITVTAGEDRADAGFGIWFTERGAEAEFSLWGTEPGSAPQRLVPGTTWAAWAGSDALLTVGPDHRPAFVDTSGARQIPTDAISSLASRVWMGASGTRTYIGADGNDLWVMDPATGERVAGPIDLGAEPVALTSTRDEKRILVTTSLNGVSQTRLIDATTGAAASETLTGPTTTVLAGDEVIGADATRLTRYALPGMTEIGSLPSTSAGTRRLQVSADGGTLLATGTDGSVALYDLGSGLRLGDTIPANGRWGADAFLRPDGNELAVARADGVQVWDLDPARHAEAACRVAGRDLTRTEWAAYLGGIGPYRSTCGFGED